MFKSKIFFILKLKKLNKQLL